MSAWAFHDLLRDDIDAWVATMKARAKAEGQTLLGSLFRERLAAKIGVVSRQLDRYCAGETMPSADALEIISRETGANRAVRELARRCGLGVYDLVPGEGARWTDQVGQAAAVIREAGEAAAGAMAADRDRNGDISINEYRAVAAEIQQALQALERLDGMLRERMESALAR